MFCLLHIPNFTIAVVSGRKCSGPACGDYQGAFRCLFIFLWILTLSHMGTWSRTFYRFLALQLVKKFDAWIQNIGILGFLRLKLTLGTRYTVFCFFFLICWYLCGYPACLTLESDHEVLCFRFSKSGCLLKQSILLHGCFNTHQVCVALQWV